MSIKELGRSKSSQVMFVLDVTQSMSNEIKGIKLSIKDFVAAIEKLNLQVGVGLTWFRDIEYDQRPGCFDFHGSPFTNDTAEFINQVNDLTARGGGGNSYESSKHALFIAAKQFTDPNTNRFMVLVTDQRPYPDGQGKDPSTQLVISTLVKAQINQLYCVIRSKWRKQFEPLCEPLSAKVFDLSEDGRSPETFESVLRDISQSITTYLRRF